MFLIVGKLILPIHVRYCVPSQLISREFQEGNKFCFLPPQISVLFMLIFIGKCCYEYSESFLWVQLHNQQLQGPLISPKSAQWARDRALHPSTRKSTPKNCFRM